MRHGNTIDRLARDAQRLRRERDALLRAAEDETGLPLHEILDHYYTEQLRAERELALALERARRARSSWQGAIVLLATYGVIVVALVLMARMCAGG